MPLVSTKVPMIAGPQAEAMSWPNGSQKGWKRAQITFLQMVTFICRYPFEMFLSISVCLFKIAFRALQWHPSLWKMVNFIELEKVSHNSW